MNMQHRRGSGGEIEERNRWDLEVITQLQGPYLGVFENLPKCIMDERIPSVSVSAVHLCLEVWALLSCT